MVEKGVERGVERAIFTFDSGEVNSGPESIDGSRMVNEYTGSRE